MTEKRFRLAYEKGDEAIFEDLAHPYPRRMTNKEVENLLNEQQELIEELQVSDEMGWKRAEMFEKKCPKELHNKKMYIKRLEYKVQKFKEENEQLKNKLNVTALELVDEAISMGKAVEISEMNYHEFLEYRQKKGKAMELQR